MADHADLVRARTSARREAGEGGANGPAHGTIECRAEARAERNHRDRLNRRPEVAAQRRVAERLAGRAPGASPVQRAAAPNKTGLPDRLKNGIEALSGMRMDDVRVHYNSARPSGLNAMAFAEGTDIHVAPGQERHLPHEAWHVVQQKQGRVRATTQMKGTGINDDSGLEREADAMGARAAQIGGRDREGETLATTRPGGGVVQAFAIAREPKLGTLYSLSDDRQMVTGMGTPNHELFVDSAGKIDAIKAAAAQSMLDFTAGGKAALFGQPYVRVQAGFKKVKFDGPPKGVFGTTERLVDLDDEYHSKVAPAIGTLSVEKYKSAIDQIRGKGWADQYSEIKAILGNLVPRLELFKKLVIANQAKEGYHDVVNPMDAPQAFVLGLEKAVYSKTSQKAALAETNSALAAKVARIKHDFRDDALVLETLEELLEYAAKLEATIPDGPPVDLMLVHSANYQESMLASISRKDPMFYRACDVMASTVMGNKLTPQNKDQLKVYSAGGTSSAFHYAAKILKSGNDWVTLESFAASEREQQILGINPQNAPKNLDNSWQYMMYGSIKKGGETGGEEDRAFELYTKLRYRLKGIEAVGEFRTDQRNRLTGTIEQNALVGIGGFDGAKSAEVWDRLQRSGVFDAQGEVRNPAFLETDYVSLRLDEADRPHAAAISARLKQCHATPRSKMRHVQSQDNNEMKNVAAWSKLLGLDLDTGQLAYDLMQEMQTGADPNILHGAAWKRLMLAMEKKG